MFSFSALLILRSGLYLHRGLKTMTHKVFVYGTLKRNEPNHHWLTQKENGYGKFLTEGTTKTKYPLIIATRYNIPFLLFSPGKGYNVKGEVYEVDDTMLSKLDILEEHPDYYVREIDDINVLKDGSPTLEKCWVYFLKKFKPDLLSRPHFESYTSSGSHGMRYMESREEGFFDEMDDIIKNNNESTIEDLDDDYNSVIKK